MSGEHFSSTKFYYLKLQIKTFFAWDACRYFFICFFYKIKKLHTKIACNKLYAKNRFNYITNASGIIFFNSYWSHHRNFEKEQGIFLQFLSQFKNILTLIIFTTKFFLQVLYNNKT
jgi:hypothetical protein